MDIMNILSSLDNIATILTISAALVVTFRRAIQKIKKKPLLTNIKKGTEEVALIEYVRAVESYRKLLKVTLAVIVPIFLFPIAFNTIYPGDKADIAAYMLGTAEENIVKAYGEITDCISSNSHSKVTYIYTVGDEQYKGESELFTYQYNAMRKVNDNHLEIYYSKVFPEVSIATDDRSIDMEYCFWVVLMVLLAAVYLILATFIYYGLLDPDKELKKIEAYQEYLKYKEKIELEKEAKEIEERLEQIKSDRSEIKLLKDDTNKKCITVKA